MNLSFNTSIHILTFLTKHKGEQYTSSQLAESVCINPVQIRRVIKKLVEADLIKGKRGKNGGYTIIAEGNEISLGYLYRIFNEVSSGDYYYTGQEDNPCMISSNIKSVMRRHEVNEIMKTADYYDQFTIEDILKDIIKENMYETI